MPCRSKRTSASASMEIPLLPRAHPVPQSATPSMFGHGTWCLRIHHSPWRHPPLHTRFPGYSTQTCLVHRLKALVLLVNW
ncbi:unnamed protein product [Urochloa humidicola]